MNHLQESDIIEILRSFQNNNEIPENNNQHQQFNSNIDPNKKLSKKEQMKMMKKQEKAEKKEYKRRLMEERKIRELIKEKEMQIKAKIREEKMKNNEEESVKDNIKEDDNKKENEANKLNIEDENIRKMFVEYIKIRKVVSLIELSYTFHIKINEAIDILTQLEKNKYIFGVIDESGKYICINEDECTQIENLIEDKGKMSITQLTEECNRIIRLEMNEADKATLYAEHQILMSQLEKEVCESENKE